MVSPTRGEHNPAAVASVTPLRTRRPMACVEVRRVRVNTLVPDPADRLGYLGEPGTRDCCVVPVHWWRRAAVGAANPGGVSVPA